MNESSNKRIVIVGFFVFIGLSFLIAGILVVGNLHKTFAEKLEVVAVFDDVAGLQKGNNVWLSGVKVGTISNLTFNGKSKVKVSILIDMDVRQYVPNDSKVKISSDGFIGNKILVIFGGSEGAKGVQNGDTLVVEKTFSSEEMLNTLRKSNDNVFAITTDFKAISKKIVSGEGTVGKLLNDDSVFANLNKVTTTLQTATLEAEQVMRSLKAFSSNLNKEGTLANELATDTVVFNTMKASVLQLQQITNTALAFISNLNQKANDSKTSLGVLLNDEESGAHLKETIKNLESSSKKLNEDLEALQHNALLKKYFKNKAKANQKDSTTQK